MALAFGFKRRMEAIHLAPILALFGVCFGVANANAQDLDIGAWNTCANLEAIGPELDGTLSSFGWVPVDEDTRVAFRRILIDGIIASMSGGPDDTIDWLAAWRSASSLAEHLSAAPMQFPGKHIFVDGVTPTAALAVISRPEIGPETFHCIFSGNPSEPMSASLQSMSRSDEARGAIHPNPELQIWRVTNSENIEEDPTKRVVVDTMFGYFREPLEVPRGRPVKVEMGFSLIRMVEE